jgi:signal transduction histidine kinase
MTSGLLAQLLAHPEPLLLHPSTISEPAPRTILDMLGTSSAVAVGVAPGTGPSGCLLLGREGAAGASDLKADEELVSILANQLAAAVENSSLYEKAWTSQQELERLVQERTRALEEANAALLGLNKAKSDFLSAVSHELRTPMAAIKGYASLLRSGQFGALEAPQAERIGKIEKHVDLLTLLINNLLDIARIESGRITMERQMIPLAEFLTGIHDVVQPQLDAKRLAYTVETDGLTRIVGDPQHLPRVFVNLLSNAIKYTPEGGSIRLELKPEGDGVTASVSDTGCGIAPEELPKLFQEFYRAQDPVNQQIKGTGLGLALVKRIVEAHHGRVSVISEKGHGSTFMVSLPMSHAAPAAA